jgi:hypothetical protein
MIFGSDGNHDHNEVNKSRSENNSYVKRTLDYGLFTHVLYTCHLYTMDVFRIKDLLVHRKLDDILVH